MLIDLASEISSLISQRESLKSQATHIEYPHALARDIVCRARAMDALWILILDKSRSKDSHRQNIDELYNKLLQEVSRSFKEENDSLRSTRIGGVVFSILDGMATVAEKDEDLLEEIEFSFLYYGLVEYCIRAWLNERFVSKTRIAIEVPNGDILETPNFGKYDEGHSYFGEKIVKSFLHEYLKDAHIYLDCRFPEDSYSQATSNISEYIYTTPNLRDFIIQNPQIHPFPRLLDEYESIYTEDSSIVKRVLRLKEVITSIEEEKHNLNLYEESKVLLDNGDLTGFAARSSNQINKTGFISRASLFECCSILDVKRLFRSKVDDELLQDSILSEHPYVCASVAADCFEQSDWENGFVFLQKALFWAFSYPNPFYNNKEAVCGCAEALLMFRQLLFLDNSTEFEKVTGTSFFKLLYFYITRAIFLCRKNLPYAQISDDKIPIDVVRVVILEVELADLIDEFSEILEKNGITTKDVRLIAENHRACARKLLDDWGFFILSLSLGDSISNHWSEFYYSQIMMMFFEGEVASSYNHGLFYVEKSCIADYIQQLTQQYTTSNCGVKRIDVQALHTGLTYTKDLSENQRDQIRLATKKDSLSIYREFLDKHGIKVLYHFTDRENLPNIRKYGLLSLDYINRKGIESSTGGDLELQAVDKEFHNEDYIHLSYIERHPMGWRLKREYKNRDLVILKISPEVIYSVDTLYSDINAANPAHIQGGDYSVLSRVNMAAVGSEYSQQDSEEQEQKAAEVMVKRRIPIDYILNLDAPETF